MPNCICRQPATFTHTIELHDGNIHAYWLCEWCSGVIVRQGDYANMIVTPTNTLRRNV